MLKKYAEVLVKKGVNLQKNQILVIEADVECFPLVRKVSEIAYHMGASDVVVNYSDEVLQKLSYQYHDVSYFNNIKNYIKVFRNDYAQKNAAFLFLTSEDPEGLSDINPQKIATYSEASHKQCDIFYDKMYNYENRWCIAGYASLKWANKVFPDMSDDEAIESLWKAIYHACFIDMKDPLKAYDKHQACFEDKLKILNEMNITSLHYTNKLGTNLTVGLVDDYLFAGGGSYTKDGIYSFPNIPTYEMFSVPHRFKVNGRVYSTMPLNYHGTLIKDFYLDFKDGKIVNYEAKKGYEALRSIIETDEGSHYIGEIAFVNYHSPIRDMNILFYNTLFDENASCHIAIGSGYSECLKNGLSYSKEELLNYGVNDSLTHVDFMIGSSDLQIEATLKNGEKHFLMKNGEYTF